MFTHVVITLWYIFIFHLTFLFVVLQVNLTSEVFSKKKKKKKRAIHVINHASYSSRTDILFATLGILKMDDIYSYFLGRYIFSHIYNLKKSPYLKISMCTKHKVEHHSINLTASADKPLKNIHRGPDYCNILPVSIKEVPRLNIFLDLDNFKMYVPTVTL